MKIEQQKSLKEYVFVLAKTYIQRVQREFNYDILEATQWIAKNTFKNNHKAMNIINATATEMFLDDIKP